MAEFIRRTSSNLLKDLNAVEVRVRLVPIFSCTNNNWLACWSLRSVRFADESERYGALPTDGFTWNTESCGVSQIKVISNAWRASVGKGNSVVRQPWEARDELLIKLILLLVSLSFLLYLFGLLLVSLRPSDTIERRDTTEGDGIRLELPDTAE